jgi:hypothetical protein
VSETKEEANESKPGRGRGRYAPVPSREICLCGHRATVHAAYRYACQAPGNRKGFCECMRFISRSSPVGKRLRAVARDKATASTKTE